MKRKRRDAQFWVRLSVAEKTALTKLASERDLPASYIVRQAIQTALAAAGTERTR